MAEIVSELFGRSVQYVTPQFLIFLVNFVPFFLREDTENNESSAMLVEGLNLSPPCSRRRGGAWTSLTGVTLTANASDPHLVTARAHWHCLSSQLDVHQGARLGP